MFKPINKYGRGKIEVCFFYNKIKAEPVEVWTCYRNKYCGGSLGCFTHTKGTDIGQSVDVDQDCFLQNRN